jgi:hypothetical protein
LAILQLANVTLHDFGAVKEITHDLANYGDVIHHTPAVDLKALSWLAERKYVVDRAAPTTSQEQAYRTTVGSGGLSAVVKGARRERAHQPFDRGADWRGR